MPIAKKVEKNVLKRGENLSTWKKTSWSKGENQQHTQPKLFIYLCLNAT